ncbi:MAG TPA: hypothetical protein VF451_07695 [Acidobacteriota bacterium]
MLLLACLWAAPARAQFRDDFSGPSVKTDPDGISGWSFFTGDGKAAMDFRQGGPGFASIFVDASRDRRNVWWALIERRVLLGLDAGRLKQPGRALRIEARLRVSQAPRRVNLQILTQRTTDDESNLMEFDIAEPMSWQTISLTVPHLDAGPGDSIIAHLALMDWGSGKYRVDLDYIKVDLVDPAEAGPDRGVAVPYHPPLPAPASFASQARVAQDATIDLEDRDVNLGDWAAMERTEKIGLIAVAPALAAILRWDLGAWKGKKAAGHGVLELTTRTLERKVGDLKDFGLVRVVEILGGDPAWVRKTATAASLCAGKDLDRVLDPQMIIDSPVSAGDGGKTYFTISRPVLQRLLDGKTLGLALLPLGAIHAAFYSVENKEGKSGARLLFNTK